MSVYYCLHSRNSRFGGDEISCPKPGSLGLFLPLCFGLYIYIYVLGNRLLNIIWFPLNPQLSKIWAICYYSMSVKIRSPVSGCQIAYKRKPSRH